MVSELAEKHDLISSLKHKNNKLQEDVMTLNKKVLFRQDIIKELRQKSIERSQIVRQILRELSILKHKDHERMRVFNMVEVRVYCMY